MVRSFMLAGLMIAAVSPAIAQEMAAPMSSRMERGGNSLAGTNAFGMPGARAHALARLRATLRELRREGLALRAADGGTLTPEHLAFIQARLDSAQAAYQRYQHAPW